MDEIRALGGEAVANTDNVATWAGAKALVDQAVTEFGRLDILVNNAGILRDGFIASLEESQWDSVIDVHLKGHFAPLHFAAEYWKDRSKAGEQVAGAVINTASASGTTLPNAGQANYGAAKAGIAALTLVAADELERYGVRVNAIAPIARTRLTLATPGMGATVRGRARGGRGRPVLTRTDLAARRLAGLGEVPGQRQGLRRQRRVDPAAEGLVGRAHRRDRRRLDDRGRLRRGRGLVMIAWSDADLAIRDAIRDWIDKEIRPHLDELETGALPPYGIIRKLFADFGLGAMAADAVEKMLAAERRRAESPADSDEKAPADTSGLNGAESMAAIVVSELAGVSLGVVASLGVSLGLGAGTIASKGTLAQKERWLPKLVTFEQVAAWAITEPDAGSDAFGGMKTTVRRDPSTAQDKRLATSSRARRRSSPTGPTRT